MNIPETGLDRHAILETLRAYKTHDARWRDGRVMAGVYDAGPEIEATIKAAYTEFLTENALYLNFYPSLVRLETEVVRMVAGLLRGDENTVGNVTSGGTESIMLAVKAARDKARAERGVTAGEVVLPVTAHPAFHKAAHYLGLTVRVTPVDLETFRADAEAIAAAITANTVLVVVSAPCYSHGTVDPVAAVARVAQGRDVPLHVDACVGGVQLSFMRRAGLAVPDFDFSVPGVASISVDMHKYGYAAKNASVVLYRDRAYRRYAMYANANTTGYAVINTTVLSSKSGGPIAGAWATLHALGQEGYLRITREVLEATRQLIAGVNATPGLRVLGQPGMCLFTMACDKASVFELEDEMTARGWRLQAQFSAGGGPANLHVSVNHSNVPHVDEFLSDLRSSLEAAQQTPPVEIEPIRDAVLEALRDPGPDTLEGLLAMVGASGSSLPERYALINTLLDALPDEAVNGLLVEYLNGIYG